MKKILFVFSVILMMFSLNSQAASPASVEYVQAYVQSQIARIPAGPIGATGPEGPIGPAGPAGESLDFADFFALMPPDNTSTVTIGGDVDFPQNGPRSTGSLITRLSSNSFYLGSIGLYQVMFQVSVSEAGQLALTLNGAPLANTVVGRATGTNQIVGISIIQTTVNNSILTVRNESSSSSLTITPLAGGNAPVSAHLVITRLQ